MQARNTGSIPVSSTYGRLTQRLEYHVYTVGVGGPNPSPPTQIMLNEQFILSHPELTKMGHAQSPNNLGLGWFYYAIARLIEPKVTVVIGSYRGFVPIILGQVSNKTHFIDPSLVDDFWKQPQQEYFKKFGANVEHFLGTTQEFVRTDEYKRLTQVDLLFVDGMHTKEQAKFDYEAFERFFDNKSVALFHDSVRIRQSKIYGEPYTHTVKEYMDDLKKDKSLQVLFLPYGDGITMVCSNYDSNYHPF